MRAPDAYVWWPFCHVYRSTEQKDNCKLPGRLLASRRGFEPCCRDENRCPDLTRRTGQQRNHLSEKSILRKFNYINDNPQGLTLAVDNLV